MLPIDCNPLLPRETIVVKELLVPAPVLMHEPGYFHVEAAIFGDLEQSAFTPPADGIEPGGGLAHA